MDKEYCRHCIALTSNDKNDDWLCGSHSNDNINSFDDCPEKEDEDPRECDVCGKVMVSGYCISDGEEYYCSDKCLHTKYTQKEYMKMYDDGYAYWTEWED